MTRKILRILGSRYGIAALLLLIVIAVVTIANANSQTNPDGRTNQNGTVDNIEPGASDDGFVPPSPEPHASESSEEVLPQSAIATAAAFAAAWVDTAEVTAQQWYDAVSQYAAPELQTQLKDVDPQQVPATKVEGEPVATTTGVEIDTDQGLLVLRMSEENGNWYVAGIDFFNE